MAKRKKNKTADQSAAMRRANWNAKVDSMKEGRMPPRAVTFPDRRKVASKKACRGKVAW